MAEEKPKKEVPQVDESDLKERTENFLEEFKKLLGKYELAVIPGATLEQVTPQGHLAVLPNMQIRSDRKPQKVEGEEEKKSEPKAGSDLAEG